MIASPTIAPGQRVVIRIVATITRKSDDITVNYMGECFTVPLSSLIAPVDGYQALIEAKGTVIRSTGRVSYLVNHAGHALRIHEQQIRAIESEVAR